MAGTVVLGSLAIVAVGCAGRPAKPVDPSIIPTLAGRWTGHVTGTGGAALPAVLLLEANGSYAISIPVKDIVTTGTISVVNGQLVLKNTGLSGPNQDLANATGTLYLSDEGGMQQISGNATNRDGPFS